MVRVLVVDDHPIVRDGLAALLATVPDLEVVGQTGDGETAVRLTVRDRPAVVLMELDLPACRRWRRRGGSSGRPRTQPSSS